MKPISAANLDLRAFGEHAVRFALPDGLDRGGALARLRALPGVVDAALAEVTGLVVFDGKPPEEAALAGALVVGEPAEGREHRVRVRYDGPDLGRVADWARMPVEEVVRRHAARTYVVRFVGFLPGFAYLGEVDPAIAAPRLPAPRARVPAAAVGIAGGRTAVYPCASPGGWNLVGEAVEFAAFGAEGAALGVGDRVRFVPA